MTIRHAIAAVRTYGLRGIYDFMKRMPRCRKMRRMFEDSLVRDSSWRPRPGITIIGNMSSAGSLSKVLRDFVERLKTCRIPHQAFDTNDGDRIPASEYAHLLTPDADFRLNRFTDIVGMTALPALPKTDCRLSHILFWEFEDGISTHDPNFILPMEIIAMADPLVTTFRRFVAKSIPVSKILYPFTFKPGRLISASDIRAKYGIAADDFVVFYNFSYASCYCRKNPEGAVRAFAEALGGCADVKFVFKTMCARDNNGYAARLHSLVASLGLSDRVIFIDNYLLQDELVSLTNACDVYLSLHRGEGFGLGIAEAMSLGKPVVITNYCAPTEYCTEGNSMLVPYTLVSVKPEERDAGDHRISFYENVRHWPEPDVHAAAKALRRLYDDRAFAKQLGENARRFIADYFSDANFTKSVEAFLARG